MKIINNCCKFTDSLIFKTLYEYNFIIDKDIDEYKFYTYKLLKEIYSTDRLELTIVPTQSCNFRCRYCYQEHDVSEISDIVLQDIVSFIRKNIKKYRSLYISWFGGEPLLQFNKIKLIMKEAKNICKENNVPIVGGITTNGYLLDEFVFAELLKHNIYDYQVTIDGLKETHNFQRPLKDGSETFDKIINNILKIKQSINRKFNFVIRINISNEILNNIDEYINFISKIISDDKRFSILWHRIQDYGGNEIKLNHNMIVEDVNIDKIVFDKGLENGIKTYSEVTQPKTFMCEACKKNSYIINYDGIIYKCTNAINKREKLADSSIGILKDGEMYINEKKEMMWILQENIESECGDCLMLPVCCHAICPNKLKLKKTKECKYNPNVANSMVKSIFKENKMDTLSHILEKCKQ
ncbi:radical SAM protein [Lutispora thermophila]|uniref:radical SAM protein n=1 Tax=Lutispora thermophila TaxID=288966 RepID=UPI0015874171|nr:radical SAM protein [Lutispora thermophila]